MTKHSFLSKIKDAASAGNGKSDATLEKEERNTDKETKQTSKWDALKDDYLLDPKKVRMNQLLKFILTLLSFFSLTFFSQIKI